MTLAHLRADFGMRLSASSPAQMLEELQQLFIDCMDYYEQGDYEDLFIQLDKVIGAWRTAHPITDNCP